MDDTLLTAVIAALSALSGSLIPTVVGYLNNNKQREFEFKKALFDKQTDIYLELMLSLQEMVNTRSNEQFIALQQVALKVAIFGDDKTSKAFNKYYRDVIKSGQNVRKPLTPEEHKNHQVLVLNGMREQLGMRPLDDFEIVAFRPNQNQRNT